VTVRGPVKNLTSSLPGFEGNVLSKIWSPPKRSLSLNPRWFRADKQHVGNALDSRMPGPAVGLMAQGDRPRNQRMRKKSQKSRIQFGPAKPFVPTAPAGKSRRLVLVLDDDPTARLMIRILLEVGAGVRVLEAQTDEEAKEAATQFNLDLLLCNLARPCARDGLEFIRAFRRGRPYVPIIVVSSALDPLTRSLAFKAGASACVGKLFAASNLVEAVRRTLPNAQASRSSDRWVRRETAWLNSVSRCLEGRWKDRHPPRRQAQLRKHSAKWRRL
jgi:CheY-like chemotaxis protein